MQQLEQILHPLNRQKISDSEYYKASEEFQFQLEKLGKQPETHQERQMSEWNNNGHVSNFNKPGKKS